MFPVKIQSDYKFSNIMYCKLMNLTLNNLVNYLINTLILNSIPKY